MVAPRGKDLAFLESHSFVRQTVVEKIHGCIIGSALGDAIGLFTEFETKQSCERIYPDRSFTLVGNTYKIPGFELNGWTDDTDHAILLILTYLYCLTKDKSKADYNGEFAKRFVAWTFEGLRALGRPPAGIGILCSDLTRRKEYPRNPFSHATDFWEKRGCRDAPNGSLMRIHPLGVICIGLSEEETLQAAASNSQVSHVDPRCVVSCCVSVFVIRGLLRGEIETEAHLDAAIERVYTWTLAQSNIMNPAGRTDLSKEEISSRLDRDLFVEHAYAQSLEDLYLDEDHAIGYTYKCMGSAVLLLRQAMRRVSHTTGHTGGVLRRMDIFEDLMTDLVMEGGDADTNGAAAGALLGTYLGCDALPRHWVMGLRHRGWLVSKIERLCIAVGVQDGNLLARRDERRDGGKGKTREGQLEESDSEDSYEDDEDELSKPDAERQQTSRGKPRGKRRQTKSGKGKS